MRTLLASLLTFTLVACTNAEEKDKDKEKDAEKKPPLKVGDPAPPIKVTTWLKGAEVKGFEAGKVYVVDFWATWCGPCIASMPHMSELQAEYKDQGLTAIAFTTKDGRGNDAASVEKFVKGKGSRFDFTFAYSDNDLTYDAYMTASGQDGIPCSFVIDKAGKVAFIGHPMELDDVLPKVVAGTWRGQADVDEIAAVTKELGAIFEKAEKEPVEGLKRMVAFEAKYPLKAKQSMFQVTKVAVMLQAKQFDEAKALTEGHVAKLAEKRSTQPLMTLRAIWSDKELNPDKKHPDVAVKVADAILAIEGDKDPSALMAAADSQFLAGNKAKAAEYTKKAIEHADNDRLKKFLTDKLAEYQK